MTHTTPPPVKLVKVPWARSIDVDRKLVEYAYKTCQRADKAHCINTNLVRAFAEHLGRVIRHPHTFKGEFHWSEMIDDQWCMFVAPLSLKYAKRIDAFDHEGKHFWPPVKCPMGPVRFVGFSKIRRDTADAREARRKRLNVRVSDGVLVPGARFRERQTPYVIGINTP